MPKSWRSASQLFLQIRKALMHGMLGFTGLQLQEQMQLFVKHTLRCLPTRKNPLQCSAPAVHRHRLHRPRLLSTAHMSTQAFAKWMDLQASDSSYRMSSEYIKKKTKHAVKRSTSISFFSFLLSHNARTSTTLKYHAH